MIPPGRPVDRETLTQAIAELHDETEYAKPVQIGALLVPSFNCDCLNTKADDPLQRPADGDDTYCLDRWVLLKSDVEYALSKLPIPAPVGGQTPTEQPQKLTDDMIHQMLGEAEAAYNRARSDAAGSGEGHRVQHEFGKFAKAETVRSYLFQAGIIPAPVGEQTPTDPDEETPLSAYNRGRLAVCTELTLAVEQFNDDDTKGGAGQLCEAIAPWLLNDSDVAAPPPPGAPPAFTREEVAAWIHSEERDDRTLAMLRDYYDLLPTEGRQENGAKISGAQR